VSENELEVTHDDVKRRLDAGQIQVVDVREPEEWDAGRIAGDVRHIPLGALQEQAGTLDPERPVVFSCKSGGRSLWAAQAFRAAGVEAYSMAGGLEAWLEAGLPVDPPGGTVADH
jgi:rhodanese-related sulfurtransferase